jgi:segregation and condensation protein B
MPESRRKTPRTTDADEVAGHDAPAAEAASPNADATGADEEQSPLSLGRLRAAFAQMLGDGSADDSSVAAEATVPNRTALPAKTDHGSDQDSCEISPRTIVEAMLFVGRADGGSISAREMAAAMRGVSPAEIDAAVAELNGLYERDAAPYHIVGSAPGYRLVLRDEFGRMRDKFLGRLKEAKLSPATVEALSVVAYHQPTTAEAVSELRGTPSGTALASLVRRKLVRIDRPADRGEPPRYSTTDRFLRLFRLENVAALPRSEELEKL